NEALFAILVQFPFVIVLSPLVGMLQGTLETASFLVGGLVCVFPNFYLYRRVFAHQGARAAKRIFKSLCVGQMIKVILTVIGFSLAISSKWVVPLWLFIGYITAQIGFALAPLIARGLKNNQGMKAS
ncbi:MAG TPA: ATP synthase subunit I, partial [Candidatus Berkiella sp.]|nr:ATP synthase subunit I [Candidatus Berkiella sp.]